MTRHAYWVRLREISQDDCGCRRYLRALLKMIGIFVVAALVANSVIRRQIVCVVFTGRWAATFCVTANLSPRRPEWVKTGRDALKFRCPLYPQKRTSLGAIYLFKERWIVVRRS